MYILKLLLAMLLLLGAAYSAPGCTNGSASADDDGSQQGSGDTTAIIGIGDAVITDDGTYRYLTASGVPDHETGQFPGPGNPNTISVQNYHFRMALHPAENAAPAA